MNLLPEGTAAHVATSGTSSSGIAFLIAAAVFVPFFHRFRVSPVLGFLLVGALLGPFGLGRLEDHVPFVSMFTISQTEDVHQLAELGVVFLLFAIGLELTWERLKAMRRMVFGLGALQIVLCAAVLTGLFLLLGRSIGGSVAVAMGLALSSTAMVMPVMAERKRLHTATGRSVFAVLLAQDLAVAPIMVTVIVLASGTDSFGISGLLALIPAILAIGLIVVGGRLLLRPLFRSAALAKSAEIFMAACFLVVLVSGQLAVWAGLSMGLGAFIAGLLLAETEYRREIEMMVEPFKGLLLGLFFVTVGARLDFAIVMAQPVLVLGFAVALIALKIAIVAPIARSFGLSWRGALEAAAVLAPAGEFAFVIIDEAVGRKLVSSGFGHAVIVSAIVSMFLVPALAMLGGKVNRKSAVAESETAVAPSQVSEKVDVLVVGYGRVGELVVDMLKRHDIPFAVIDANPRVTSRARKEGVEAWYGDASNPEMLLRMGLDNVRAVVVTVSNATFTDNVVSAVRTVRTDVGLIARARDARHAEKLYGLGVTDAVPETIEASLQLAENTLVDLGVPMGLVLASIHEKRDEFRKDLLKYAPDGHVPRILRSTLRKAAGEA
ncbi:cation:proton antiporter [Asticcacaulis sp. YBE204]|uniref:cation:proton antiporter domain-containing protein n=1 Tax=Asticcacaulis sp. YBE204 TaxID=1282363 RepID=UPI0003C3C966|nr:cation:proton antiporter [Asticcacaulis sp. YBE204]ESQ79605.1 potassium transporter TrkA [Asticcacaulis sp. YBE204]